MVSSAKYLNERDIYTASERGDVAILQASADCSSFQTLFETNKSDASEPSSATLIHAVTPSEQARRYDVLKSRNRLAGTA